MCSEGVQYGLNPQFLMDLRCLLVKSAFSNQQWRYLVLEGHGRNSKHMHSFVEDVCLISAYIGTDRLSLLDASFKPFMAHCIYNYAPFGHIPGLRHGTLTIFPLFRHYRGKSER